MRKCHELKCDKRFYGDVESGQKPFEVRENDRDYKVGDHLWLREGELRYTGSADVEGDNVWSYTGNACVKGVTYVLTHAMFHGVREGYVVLGLKQVLL
jgi:ParB family chromosome partitioning protein